MYRLVRVLSACTADYLRRLYCGRTVSRNVVWGDLAILAEGVCVCAPSLYNIPNRSYLMRASVRHTHDGTDSASAHENRIPLTQQHILGVGAAPRVRGDPTSPGPRDAVGSARCRHAGQDGTGWHFDGMPMRGPR